MRRCFRGCCCCLLAILALSSVAFGQAPDYKIDPISRHIHIAYTVPAEADGAVDVDCLWSPAGLDDWRSAKVMPLIGETASRLLPIAEWNMWMNEGLIRERGAAGLRRTVVFNPYPDAQVDGHVEVDFRIVIRTLDGAELDTNTLRIVADNSDVVYIEDWTQVFQRDVLDREPGTPGAGWKFRGDDDGASLGNALYGDAGLEVPIPPLSYPLDLSGSYAIFVNTPGAIRMRLTGDERDDALSSRPQEEVLWRWAKMDRQHLVIEQPHRYTGYAPAALDYVKLVPLDDAALLILEGPYEGARDKLVAGYWEPYSYAFHDHVTHPLWHREYLTAYPEARVDIADMQIGRFGMKVVYESRLTDNLYYATRGDPIGTVAHPQTDNVGRMQQFTNTLAASVRHADELGIRLHANFGASNCYPGSPLQGDFSKEHPEWMRGSVLRYEVPEVREYALSLYREALEIGARGISLDFCRYPETIDTVETCNTFLRSLRALADTFEEDGERVPILVRFPAHGVRKSELFDYATWAREKWVDYLCPSNIQGRHHHFDVAPYLAAVKDTKALVLPCVDGLGWGPTMPGPFLWRVKQIYDAGAPGVYVYQADARVLGIPNDRRAMRLLGSHDAINRWWTEEAAMRSRHSKGIYISPPQRVQGYPPWHRLRIWTEGIPMGRVECYLDGEMISHQEAPPYMVGTEEYDSDRIIPPGEHELLVRAQDGDGWIERTFKITGAP